jgi:Fe-S cluster assembly protein SufD
MSALLDSLAAPFEALELREAAGLGPARRAALADALRDGLPGPRSEAWRYTNLRALDRRIFAPAAPAQLDDAAVLAIAAPRMVFVNGRFDASRSDLSALSPGIRVEPLSQLLARGDGRECGLLAQRFERAHEVFARLNSALAQEGMVLRADAGARATRPVNLVCVGAASDGDAAWHLRHLVELHEDACVALVEHVIGDVHAHLSNTLMQVDLHAQARLVHARVQDESEAASVFARTDAMLAQDACYRRLDLELGAALARNELNASLLGDRAALHANGVLLATGRRHVDTRLGVDHVARDSRCDLTWRGLGMGRARAAFHGGILIREGADGTEAMLSNKNLLLSSGAEIDTQPVLEIHADEVKAAHGATVGQLDPTSLFYLRSRGLPAADARTLLTAAFCRETLSVFEDGLVRDFLTARLDGALARSELA